jgi:hypothetical protein
METLPYDPEVPVPDALPTIEIEAQGCKTAL